MVTSPGGYHEHLEDRPTTGAWSPLMTARLVRRGLFT
jgi:hypothetical protein